MRGYLDNAATTPMCKAAKEALLIAANSFGNPSSLHSLGLKSSTMLENARAVVANALAADKSEIYFTSGGTESDNLAILGAAKSQIRKGNRIVTTSIEHSAVIKAMNELGQNGFEVIFLEPDSTGSVPIAEFANAINKDTILVSCMSVNNETGAFLPIERIKRLIIQANSPALFHVDATQSFGKYPIKPEKIGADLMSVSAHKIHGPKGIGALYIRKGARILARNFGGSQEKGIRPGTESLILINSFAAAINEIGNLKTNANNAKSLKEILKNELSKFNDIIINSPQDSSDYILNFSVLGIRSEILLHFLEKRGVFVSSGSACSKGKPSHVLSTLKLPAKVIDSAIRVSFSRFTTQEDITMLLEGIAVARKNIIKVK